MPKFSKESLAKLNTCHPKLQKVFSEAIKHVDFTVLEGHRDKAKQDAVVASGNSKTPWPSSKHNSLPSRAIDVVPYPIDWNNKDRFYLFGGFILGIAASMGIKLRFGGDWNGNFETKDQTFNDLPHFELQDDET